MTLVSVMTQVVDTEFFCFFCLAFVFLFVLWLRFVQTTLNPVLPTREINSQHHFRFIVSVFFRCEEQFAFYLPKRLIKNKVVY